MVEPWQHTHHRHGQDGELCLPPGTDRAYIARGVRVAFLELLSSRSTVEVWDHDFMDNADADEQPKSPNYLHHGVRNVRNETRTPWSTDNFANNYVGTCVKNIVKLLNSFGCKFSSPLVALL